MTCLNCDYGRKMPLDAKLSLGIYWCPQCTSCIRRELYPKHETETSAIVRDAALPSTDNSGAK